MNWAAIIVFGIVIPAIIGYTLATKRPAALKDYKLEDLKEGDRIMIRLGYTHNEIVTVFKNYPTLKKIKIDTEYGLLIIDYTDYNFDAYRSLS